MSAIHFFEATNPSVPHYGQQGVADNQAEWIVDLTTKVLSVWCSHSGAYRIPLELSILICKLLQAAYVMSMHLQCLMA